MDVQCEIEADQIGGLHRFYDREPFAETRTHDFVDCFCVVDVVGDQRESFVSECMLELVVDEVGYVVVDYHGLFADALEQVEYTLGYFGVCAFGVNDFDEWDEVRWVLLVRVYEMVRVCDACVDFFYWDHVRVGGEHGVGACFVFKVGEDLLFEL